LTPLLSLLAAFALLFAASSAFAAYTFSLTVTPATSLREPGATIAVTADVKLAVATTDADVTSIDLDVITLPTNVTPADVTVALTALTTGWSFAKGASLTAGALDIALVAGATAGNEIDTATEAATATSIATLTFNVKVPYNAAGDIVGPRADPNFFDIGAHALGSVAIPDGTSNVFVNGAAVATTGVTAGITADIIGIYQGDVSGDGDVKSNDAQATLVAVATAAITDPASLGATAFGVLTATPSWATLTGRLSAAVATPINATRRPTAALSKVSAFAVGDVDEDGSLEQPTASGDVSGITAFDAALMLRFAVGIATSFGVTPPDATPPPAPRLLAGSPADLFRVASTSARPGAQITVSLDLSSFGDLYAGELRFDYDRAVLRPVDVRIASSKGLPLLAHSTQSGDLGIAFASAYPIEGGVLHAVFEAAPGVQDSVPASIRARRLVINKTRFEPAFQHRFTIEPYRFQLMANYPNPFNPETWIPFELAEESDVTVRIYGMDGALVRALDLGRMRQGVYMKRGEAAYWDGRNAAGEHVASGVYVYELAAGDYRAMRRMVVVK
jgi:hypothetical protein